MTREEQQQHLDWFDSDMTTGVAVGRFIVHKISGVTYLDFIKREYPWYSHLFAPVLCGMFGVGTLALQGHYHFWTEWWFYLCIAFPVAVILDGYIRPSGKPGPQSVFMIQDGLFIVPSLSWQIPIDSLEKLSFRAIGIDYLKTSALPDYWHCAYATVLNQRHLIHAHQSWMRNDFLEGLRQFCSLANIPLEVPDDENHQPSVIRRSGLRGKLV